MHWLDRLMKEFDIKTRYELSKRTGIGQTSLSSISKRQTPLARVNLSVILAISEGLDLPVGELLEKLLEYEKETPSN